MDPQHWYFLFSFTPWLIDLLAVHFPVLMLGREPAALLLHGVPDGLLRGQDWPAAGRMRHQPRLLSAQHLLHLQPCGHHYQVARHHFQVARHHYQVAGHHYQVARHHFHVDYIIIRSMTSLSGRLTLLSGH
jgi:hypothetical protein